jgi:enoyl-CoA hydratase/3-hydroxyacyl-CoA dehydrogenase
LFGVTFLVASALVNEGVGSIQDVNVGARVGLRWKHGPFEWIDVLGQQRSEGLASELASTWRMAYTPITRV